MTDSKSTRTSSGPKNFVISVGSFDGFGLKDGRLSLGWLSFGSAPRDLESRLGRAVQEINALKAELERVSHDHQQQLASVQQENAALKGQVARVSEAEHKLQRALQEDQELKAQLSRMVSENDRLKALVERVSSGVR